jgi:hypothetical protein
VLKLLVLAQRANTCLKAFDGASQANYLSNVMSPRVANCGSS